MQRPEFRGLVVAAAPRILPMRPKIREMNDGANREVPLRSVQRHRHGRAGDGQRLSLPRSPSDDRACPGPAMPIFQRNTFAWMGRIKSTPAPATQGRGSIIISVRTAVLPLVGPARQDRHASAFLWVSLPIPPFRRRPHHSGRKGVTHRRLKSATSSTGTLSRHRLDASLPRSDTSSRRTQKQTILTRDNRHCGLERQPTPEESMSLSNLRIGRPGAILPGRRSPARSAPSPPKLRSIPRCPRLRREARREPSVTQRRQPCLCQPSMRPKASPRRPSVARRGPR